MSTKFKTFFALILISSKLPIGVETIYNPLFKLFIGVIFIFIVSCAPVNNSTKKILTPSKESSVGVEKQEELLKKEETTKENLNLKIKKFAKNKILNEVEIILPKKNKSKVTENLINAFELSIYVKDIKNIQFNINRYEEASDLKKILNLKASPGKIFIGTLNSLETNIVKDYCHKGILFFSFVANKELAGNCVYLINFFPDDDLRALFNHFPSESKIALLYPENFYGYNINKIIDPIAANSRSIIINRASYKEDLSNAREAIKELSKYELRKFELERQKNILKNKNDEVSKRALKKIEKFETIGTLDFTHLILPDYGIRLLEIAPLLPFYDVDPEIVQFVGTGVWDDKVFFDEPSLQGAFFSGIHEENRKLFFDNYQLIYNQKPLRTSTIAFDLVGIISYIINKEMNVASTFDFLDNSNINFDGIDGKFFFKKNIIYRDLDILKIENGFVKKLN
tara:strand:+ start:3621 stop:4985 length:1365 start_codon:yes stop_codon:yes gene_type:complete